MKTITKSWKTTALGILGAIAVLAPALHTQFDGDPTTVVASWGTVLAAAAAQLGLGAFARDHGVTSEQAGAE